jgi:hypothetical protein
MRVSQTTDATRTSDLDVAAFLLARGHRIIRVEGVQRVDFCFAPVPESVVFEFYSDEHNVSARKLLNARKDLQGLLAERRR